MQFVQWRCVSLARKLGPQTQRVALWYRQQDLPGHLPQNIRHRTKPGQQWVLVARAALKTSHSLDAADFVAYVRATQMWHHVAFEIAAENGDGECNLSRQCFVGTRSAWLRRQPGSARYCTGSGGRSAKRRDDFIRTL